MNCISVTQVKDGAVYQWYGDRVLVTEELFGQLLCLKHEGALPWSFRIVDHDPWGRNIWIEKIDLE